MLNITGLCNLEQNDCSCKNYFILLKLVFLQKITNQNPGKDRVKENLMWDDGYKKRQNFKF